jgi:hypothetical protein
MNYVLYCVGGSNDSDSAGLYETLEEAVKHAITIVKPSTRILIFERPIIPETKAIMTISDTGISRWTELHQRFNKLKEITGADKSSSYVMNVIYDQDCEISVELGCYDISDWPRSLYLGPFKTEFEALTMTELKIIEAERIVLKEHVTDEKGQAESTQ